MSKKDTDFKTDHTHLNIHGLKENNLRSLDLSIEHDQVTVVCGPSGSGKSTLAFDAIYAEGARRYVETFDPYTRQFLDRLKAPDATLIENVRPSLALEQRNRISSSRSTVGTITEINEYLKILWAHCSELECPSCGKLIKPYAPEDIVEFLSQSKDIKGSIFISFKVSYSKGSAKSIFEMLKAGGFSRIFDVKNKTVQKIEDIEKTKIQGKEIFVVVDRLSVESNLEIKNDRSLKSRMLSSFAQSYEFGKKELIIFITNGEGDFRTLNFSNRFFCSKCEIPFRPPIPALFSYNSPIGACDECQGFGKVLRIDVDKCIPNANLSISEGAISCWQGELGKRPFAALKSFCDEQKISLSSPWKDLTDKSRNLILNGAEGKSSVYKGLLPWFKMISQKRHKMHLRIFVAKYRSEFGCDVCNGSRLVRDSLNYKINSKNIFEISSLPIDSLINFIEAISVISQLDVVKSEILARLNYLLKVGLSYLTLSRQTKTLSGGEFQRVNLTTLLGANIVNSTFVLDEPTIGLHSRDTKLLIGAIRELSDRGNSLIVVEHDPDVILHADNVIELGPNSGTEGGEIVFSGTPTALLTSKTKTGEYFRDQRKNGKNLERGKIDYKSKKISIKNARLHNLKNINLDIPLNCFVAICGVSGSGKSSLLHGCLFKAFQEFGIQKRIVSPFVEIEGLSQLEEIVLIDQQPIGKSSRANPATYVKVWDEFREYFAESSEAVRLGLSKSAFSFNVDGGRCPVCNGAGVIKIEMQFLTDVQVECEACLGRRFRDQVLGIKLGDRNVNEVLSMTISEVYDFVDHLPNQKRNLAIKNGLLFLKELGLGYLCLGQSLTNLSGGEAQRLKLASYLRGSSKNKLFILDEPTTGLHPSDIKILLHAISKIVEAGNSVVCIEHNLDVLNQAEWLIELGPNGGEGGGRFVCEGRPQDLIEDRKIKSPTLLAMRVEGHLVVEKAKPKDLNQRLQRDNVLIKGAREHNLKNINVNIPKNCLCVVTGLSGSGKSTLAFDILFSEGQRRFIDCLSPYARQYISQSSKPDVDSVEGLPPTVAVSQKSSPPMGISTLATVTEIYQFLRLLFSKVGTQSCIHDGEIVTNFTQDVIVDEIIATCSGKTIYVFAPVVTGRKGSYQDVFIRAYNAEITNAKVDKKYIKITEDLKLDRHKLHWISLELGKLKVDSKNRAMLEMAISQALLLSQGSIEVAISDPLSNVRVFSLDRVCPKCKTGYLPLDPQDFSFRSARGMCHTCGGRGALETSKERKYKECPDCCGSRIGPIGRSVHIEGKTIFEFVNMAAPELLKQIQNWKYPERLAPVVVPILKELCALLDMIDQIGLGYLNLNRDASTLSGGEAQRLRLAKNLGSPLTGVCYVLDEPSIGLHVADHQRLMETLKLMRDQGNSVVVVEHDEDTIEESDYIIDVGPEAGVNGGNIVYAGDFQGLLKNKESKTAEAFRQRSKQVPKLSNRVFSSKDFVVLSGAKANNLKNVSVSFPKQSLTCVVGVSGAGKSSLLYGTLVPAVLEEFEGESERSKFYDKYWDTLTSVEGIDRMIEIDQKPIGRTPASTPASFLGIFDEIRKIFESLPESKVRGFKASHFSYNTGKGKCQVCEGRGYIKVPMSFLPDALSECESCSSYRYNEETLEVAYNGRSIGDILKLTMLEAKDVFSAFPKIFSVLNYACELGIGYLCLGQGFAYAFRWRGSEIKNCTRDIR